MSAQVDEMYVPEPSPEHQNVAQYIQGGALKTWIRLPGDPDACSWSESPIWNIDNVRTGGRIL